MEQGGGISIISPSSLTDNSAGKVKSGGLTSTTASRFMNAKEKLRLPWSKNDGSAVELIKKGAAEVIGTAILVFLGCLGCVGGMGVTPGALQGPVSFGIAVLIAVTSVGHISGAHINPSITIAAVVTGNKSLLAAGVYFICQMAGGISGYGLIKLITPQDLLHSGNPDTAQSFCTTMLNTEISVLQGFVAEALATALLIFFWCAVVDPRNADKTDSIPIKFGMAITLLCIGFGPYTGCSMNPARSFGPALINNQWRHHWVYWFGPFAGALVGALFYKAVFAPKSKENAPEGSV